MDNIDDFINRCFLRAREYGAAVEQLPQGDDFMYHMAYRGFRQLAERNREMTLDAIDAVIAAHVNENRRIAVKPMPSKVARHKAVMDGIDMLLENVDTILDDVRGSRLRGNDQQALSFGAAPSSTQHQLVKPQLSFRVPVDNSYGHFLPLMYDERSGALTRGEAGVHPYNDLISTFAYPDDQLRPKDEIAFLDVSTSPFSFIENVDELSALAKTLAAVREFAVDLEHHSYHSFQGFTCLMQISTRAHDYVVDCLKLRDEMWRLKSVFLNPRILKVFHGAHEDIRWLQKDFGIYVANMFDTGIAMQTLRMPHSLFNVVDYFCQVKLDKKYQKADWRLRPLPRDMIMYARQDTHYLLYSFDRLRILLLNSENQALGNLLLHVFQESRRVCLQRYEKPQLDADRGFIDGMGPSLGGLNSTQRAVAREVYNWRDRAARDADESPPAVLNESSILQLSIRQPTLAADVLKTVNPVTLTVRRHVTQIVDIIKSCIAEHGGSAANTEGSASVADGADGAGEKLVAFVPQTGMLPSVQRSGVMTSVLASVDTESSAQVGKCSDWYAAVSRASQALAASAVASSSAQMPRLAMPRQKLVAVVTAPITANKGAPSVTAGLSADGDAEVLVASEETHAPQAPTNEPSTTSAEKGKRVVSLAEEFGLGRASRKKAAAEAGSKRKRQ